MPVLANLPFRSRPGVTTVHLMGSSMLNPSARLPKPCHLAVRASPLMIQSSARPMPSSASLSGPQTLNHQSLPYSWSTLRIARRKSSASRIDSSTSAVPPRGHIAACDDRVLRALRGVHQVRLVEQVAVQLVVGGVLHQHVAGLADAGQQ